jgi:prephenate dehydratase
MLKFCEKWKLKINPTKSIFGVDSITHVGFIISEHGVQIDPERNRDIAELASPKSIKKVQSVLGVMNYVRNFIENFSSKAKFLTDKLAAKAVDVRPSKRKKSQAAVCASSTAQGLAIF